MSGIVPLIPILAAGIEDLLEILVPIAFVVIYLIGSALKSMAAKKEADRRHKSSAGHPLKQEKAFGSSIQRRPSHPIPQPGVQSRAQRLPYAKSASSSPIPLKESKSALENLEELRQRRLAQIRAQHQQQQTISPPPSHRHPMPHATPPRPAKPKPIQRPSQTIPVAQAIPVAQSAEYDYEQEMLPKKPVKTKSKSTVQKTAIPVSQQKLLHMLRNPVQIRNAVIASEVLGKPVSLR